MYNEINLDILSKILDVNLGCPEHLFHMKSYSSVTDCGTTHCLIGNYWQYNSHVSSRVEATIKLLGLSNAEYGFLFNLHHIDLYKGCKSAYNLSYKEALTRLAKFIIYKRRKKKLWEDYEKARRTEGDSMFCEIHKDELKELVPV